MIRSVAFTGHRPKDLMPYELRYERDAYRALIGKIASIVRWLADNSVTEFVSGGAQGLDQCAFWAVQHVKMSGYPIRNIVHVIENQPCRWAKSGTFSQDDFSQMLELADEVVTLTYDETGARSAGHLLNLRNLSMLDAADALIGCFDASRDFSRTEHSGTANTLNSARKRNMPILVMDAKAPYDVYLDEIARAL